MTVAEKTWRGSERPTVGQKTGRPWLHSWPRDHDGGSTHHPGPCAVRSMGVHRHGELGRDPPSRPRRRPEQARRLPRVRPPLGHAHQDPLPRRAARLPPHGPQAQAQARPLPGRHPPDPRGRQEGPQEAAAHRQPHLPAAPRRARLPRRPDRRQGGRRRLEGPHAPRSSSRWPTRPARPRSTSARPRSRSTDGPPRWRCS